MNAFALWRADLAMLAFATEEPATVASLLACGARDGNEDYVQVVPVSGRRFARHVTVLAGDRSSTRSTCASLLDCPDEQIRIAVLHVYTAALPGLRCWHRRHQLGVRPATP